MVSVCVCVCVEATIKSALTLNITATWGGGKHDGQWLLGRVSQWLNNTGQENDFCDLYGLTKIGAYIAAATVRIQIRLCKCYTGYSHLLCYTVE